MVGLSRLREVGVLWAPVTLHAGNGRARCARACLVMWVGNREELGSPIRKARKHGVWTVRAVWLPDGSAELRPPSWVFALEKMEVFGNSHAEKCV